MYVYMFLVFMLIFEICVKQESCQSLHSQIIIHTVHQIPRRTKATLYLNDNELICKHMPIYTVSIPIYNPINRVPFTNVYFR